MCLTLVILNNYICYYSSMLTCNNGCSGNGMCIDNFNCLCDIGWTGDDCSSHVCKDGCSMVVDRNSRSFYCQCYKSGEAIYDETHFASYINTKYSDIYIPTSWLNYPVELIPLVAVNGSDGYWKQLITNLKGMNCVDVAISSRFSFHLYY